MPTSTPASPASFTAILFDAGPGPYAPPQRIAVGADWTPIPGTGASVRAPRRYPAPLFDGRALLAVRRGQREAHPATVAAVAACVALCPEALS